MREICRTSTKLSRFAPSAEVVISDPCLADPSTVIPSDRIGKPFRDALAAAVPPGTFSYQIARRLVVCHQQLRALRYQINTLRLSWHIRRHFSEEQILTIYANQAYFEPGVTGVKNASLALFQRDPDALSLAEAALLVVLTGSPGFSPDKHPEVALRRRSEILHAMVAQGKISANEAENADMLPILTR
jgi:penicillin-binding protein 1A